jgi:lysozyme family protein
MTDTEIIDGLIKREGGYVNNPADHGGPTNFGITAKTLTAWRGRSCDATDVKDMTEAEARAIYVDRYLKPFAEAPDDVRAHLVDIAVNSGPERAKKLLATAMDAALHSNRPVWLELVIARVKFYGAIVHDNPTQATFLNGWISRAFQFL